MKKIFVYLMIALAVVLAGVYLYPVSTSGTRAIFLAALFLEILLIIVFAVYAKQFLFFLAGLIITLVGLKIIFHTTMPLSKIYTDNLKNYVGVKYVWGGENSRGIDCSGLVRKTMINALLVKSVSDYDFAKAKLAVDLWWNDCTAKSLQNGFRDYTLKVGGLLSVNDADSSLLREGDMTITLDGLHVMAYAGNGEWIEADPMIMEVISKKTPSENIWFKVPMETVRWKILE